MILRKSLTRILIIPGMTLIMFTMSSVENTKVYAQSISASPTSHCLNMGSSGTSQISWNSTNAWVFVQTNNGPLQLFAGSFSGRKSASWIRYPNTYKFTLYNNQTPLRSTTVNTYTYSGSVKASPSIVKVIVGQSGSTTINWAVSCYSTAQVWVKQYDQNNKLVENNLFSQGPSGSKKANWIKYPYRYVFELYEGTRHLKRLSSVTVKTEQVADCHSGSLWAASYCSPSCQCEAGQGDCDYDSHCKTGLKCNQNVGTKYGVSWDMDVCEDKSVETTTPPWGPYSAPITTPVLFSSKQAIDSSYMKLGSNYPLFSAQGYINHGWSEISFHHGGALSLVPNYHFYPSVVKRQLENMYRNGQRHLVLPIWLNDVLSKNDPAPDFHPNNTYSAFTLSTHLGRLKEQDEANLRSIIKEISRLGYKSLFLRFATMGANSDPLHWVHLNARQREQQYQLNKKLIFHIIDVARHEAGSMQLMFDLALEGAGWDESFKKDYLVRINNEYVSKYGLNTHTYVPGSVPYQPGRITSYVNNLRENNIPVKLLAIDVYERNGSQEIREMFTEISSLGLTNIPLIILETWYDDLFAASRIKKLDCDWGANLVGFYQWPLAENNPNARHFSHNYPISTRALEKVSDETNSCHDTNLPSSVNFARGELLLRQGQYIQTKTAKLIMQSDGNLVLYKMNNGNISKALWNTGTNGIGWVAIFQNDGNFVIYNKSNIPVWTSATNNSTKLEITNSNNIQITGGGINWIK